MNGIGLEELTKEELIGWIRENTLDLDEEKIVLNVLIQRRELIWKAQEKFFNQYSDISDQVTQFMEKHAYGPIRSGVKVLQWPSETRREYEKLEKLSKEAWENYQVCARKSHGISDKIIDIGEQKIRRKTKIMIEKREKQNGTKN